MDFPEAARRLRIYTAASDVPALTSDEIDLLLADARRADSDGNAPDGYVSWVPGQAYSSGALVVPPTRDGYVYTATVGGTASTASTGPAFPTSSTGTVVDGGVTWGNRASAPWAPTFDLNAAAAEGWRWKAAKAASMIDFTADGASFKQDQLLAHCEKMVKRYSKGTLGTMELRSQMASLTGAVVVN